MEKTFNKGDKVYSRLKTSSGKLLMIQMIVISSRHPYGSTLFKVKPVSGYGEIEVTSRNIFTPKEARTQI